MHRAELLHLAPKCTFAPCPLDAEGAATLLQARHTPRAPSVACDRIACSPPPPPLLSQGSTHPPAAPPPPPAAVPAPPPARHHPRLLPPPPPPRPPPAPLQSAAPPLLLPPGPRCRPARQPPSAPPAPPPPPAPAAAAPQQRCHPGGSSGVSQCVGVCVWVVFEKEQGTDSRTVGQRNQSTHKNSRQHLQEGAGNTRGEKGWGGGKKAAIALTRAAVGSSRAGRRAAASAPSTAAGSPRAWSWVRPCCTSSRSATLVPHLAGRRVCIGRGGGDANQVGTMFGADMSDGPLRVTCSPWGAQRLLTTS